MNLILILISVPKQLCFIIGLKNKDPNDIVSILNPRFIYSHPYYLSRQFPSLSPKLLPTLSLSLINFCLLLLLSSYTTARCHHSGSSPSSLSLSRHSQVFLVEVLTLDAPPCNVLYQVCIYFIFNGFLLYFMGLV